MRISKGMLFVILCLINASVVSGNGHGKVEIEHVGGYGDGRLVFLYTTHHNAQPSCNTYRKRWVLNLGNASGREQYSLLLAAQTARKDVVVRGTGKCDLWHDTETIYWVGFPVSNK